MITYNKYSLKDRNPSKINNSKKNSIIYNLEGHRLRLMNKIK